MNFSIALISAIYGVALVIVVWLFIRHAERKRKADYRAKAMDEILPNKLQAYERLSLYLSRIAPDEMAVREQVSVSSAKELYLAMVNAVRQEFEHNVAMQIYLSEASWKRVLKAKEEVSKALREAMKNTHPGATSLEYASEFIEIARNSCNFYVERAQEGLRKDIAGEVFED